MENKFIFTGAESGNVHLLLTAGGNRVDGVKAAARAEEALVRGDAALLRAVTGFAFGGVSPVGHLTSVPAYADWWLLDFEEIWAAAGTPNHAFSISPAELLRMTNAQVSDFVI